MLSEDGVFMDRREAGRELARHLPKNLEPDRVVVLALPRGGVPVAFEVARELGAPLDIFLVRKLGTPGHPELAMGAIASGGITVINDDVVHGLGIRRDQIEAVAAREQSELERREAAYRRDRPPLPMLTERTVILVDDGLATGSTMRAAVGAVRQQRPARVIVAVPVGAAETCRSLTGLADEVICARMPMPFSAVGQWYRDFSQTTDEEVSTLLREHDASFRGATAQNNKPA